VMYSLSPVFVNDAHPDNFFKLTAIVASPAAVAAVLSLAVTSSRPPSPPSASSGCEVNAPNFLIGVKRALTTRCFLILCLCLGGAIGLFNALYNNLQPTLCIKGYSDTFSGLMGSLLIVSGLIGSTISGIVVDRTRRFEEVMKVCFSMAGIAACSMTAATQFENMHLWIAVTIFGFGFFGFAAYPIGLEMGVEATYPVAEATSSGLIIMTGQLQGVIYLMLTNFLGKKATAREMAIQKCITSSSPSDGTEPMDWTYASVFFNVMIAVLIIVFVSSFWPKYKRVQFELERRKEEKGIDLPVTTT